MISFPIHLNDIVINTKLENLQLTLININKDDKKCCFHDQTFKNL